MLKISRSTVSLIDDSTITTLIRSVNADALHDSPVSGDQQSRSVMIVTVIGVSCSPFLREFCDVPTLLKSRPCHKFATTDFGYPVAHRKYGGHWGEHVISRRTLEYIGDRPSRPAVKVDQNRQRNCNRASRDDKLPCRCLNCIVMSNVESNIRANIEAAWSAEIQRRLVEIDEGTVELIPWDDVRSELFGESEWKEYGITI